MDGSAIVAEGGITSAVAKRCRLVCDLHAVALKVISSPKTSYLQAEGGIMSAVAIVVLC
jgi:hypothetical protein